MEVRRIGPFASHDDSRRQGEAAQGRLEGGLEIAKDCEKSRPGRSRQVGNLDELERYGWLRARMLDVVMEGGAGQGRPSGQSGFTHSAANQWSWPKSRLATSSQARQTASSQ
jgi:hypothetical protein